MTDWSQKLRELTHKKYFPLVAVVFFAFITALIFAMLAYQNSNAPIDQLRSQVSRPGRSGAATSQSQSPLDRLVSRISGRNKTQDSAQTGTTTDPTDSASQNPESTISDEEQGRMLYEKIQKEALPMPKVSVGKFVLKTPLPQAPQTVSLYKLKTNYTDVEIANMMSAMGFGKVDGQNVILEKGEKLTQAYDLNGGLYLGFNRKDGTFVLSAEKGITVNTISSSANTVAQVFLNQIGLNNPCLSPVSNYEKTSQEDAQYVVFHCSWEKLGLPLLSSLGMLNLPDNQPLKDVKLGDIDADTPDHGDLSFSSNGSLQRQPTDFNSVIVKIDETTGNVLGVSSNMQAIEETIPISNAQIISPQQAVINLNNNKNAFAFVTPTGEGFIDLRTVFANNIASATAAEVTDFVLAYNVIPNIPTDYMCPLWLTRSYGDLESGYGAKFIHALQAVDDPRCTPGSVLGSSTASTTLAQSTGAANPTSFKPAPTVFQSQGNSPKYSTFTFQTSEPPHDNSCPEASQFTNIVKVGTEPGVYMAWVDSNTFLCKTKCKSRTWYSVLTSDAAQTLASNDPNMREQLLKFRQQFWKKAEFGNRQQFPIPEGLAGQIIACTKLTTVSPSLFVYSGSPKHVSITLNPLAGVGYADPGFINSATTWNLTTGTDGKLVFENGVTRNRAHWEYRRLPILEKLNNYSLPDEGFVLKRNSVLSFVENALSAKIGLNEAETRQLAAEVNRELRQMTSENVKLTFLPQDFLNKYLTETISPRPTATYRYIVYITPATGNETVPAPLLQKISRTSFFAVEVGALAQ